MLVDVMDVDGDRGSGSAAQISARRRLCIEGFWHTMQMAQVRAEAVVSWPAMRKVII